MTVVAGPGPLATAGSVPSSRDADLRESAQRLEAAFLAEMLKGTGLGEHRGEFGGGVGEEQFTSFLREAYANEMAKRGGIGLAESIFEALKERRDGGK